MLRHLLLAMLRTGGAAHGYALMKGYTARSGNRLSIGNVYRELARLVADGLIFVAANPPGADPRRAPYGLTERGGAALAAWLETPLDGSGRNAEELTFRLAVIADLDRDDAVRVLGRLRQELWTQAKDIEHQRSLLRDAGHDRRLGAVRDTILRRRAMHLAADIDLVDELSEAISAERLPRSLDAQSQEAAAPLQRPRQRPPDRGQSSR